MTTKKDRPIIFGGEMVRAILDGRKTQTRRVVRPQPTGLSHGIPVWSFRDVHTGKETRCPYGQPGDRLWVRETWAPICGGHFIASYALAADADEARGAVFRADGRVKSDGVMMPVTTTIENGFIEDAGSIRWRPSIHMPRWASRITLEITDVRVERVQDISDGDAKAEVVDDGAPRGGLACYGPEPDPYGPVRNAFADLWDSLHPRADEDWIDNPWVWVITFKRVAP